MLLLFATPLFVGFANEIMPLQIGAPDVAFPRMNILSYYFFLFGGLILCVPRISSTPLTSTVARPGSAGDDHRSCVCGSSSSWSRN